MIVRRFDNFRGLDVRSNPLIKDSSYSDIATNVEYANTLSFGNRKGKQYYAADDASNTITRGGGGLFTYYKYNSTGGVTEELLTAANNLYVEVDETVTIAYSGSGTASLTVRAASDEEGMELVLTEDGSVVLTYDMGVGFNESSVKTLDNLDTAVDAVTGFALTLSGDGDSSQIAAAQLPVTDEWLFSNGNFVATVKQFVAVDKPFSSNVWSYDTYKNDDDFELFSSVNLNGVLYIANGYDDLMKYDGLRVYKAGMPQLARPSLASTSAGGGSAEVTEITCTGEAAVAQVDSIVCVAETSAAQVTDITVGSYSGAANLDGYWSFFTIGRIDASTREVKVTGVVVRNFWGGYTDPPLSYMGADEKVTITIVTGSGETLEDRAEKLRVALDAEAGYSATRSGTVVTVTNAVAGDPGEPNMGALGVYPGTPWTAEVTTDGNNGLDGAYFTLPHTTGVKGFWFDVSGSTSQPTFDADTYVEISTVNAGDTNTAVAAAVDTIITAQSEFSSSRTSATLTVTHANAGNVEETLSAGTTGFTVSTSTGGRDSLDGKYFLTYDTNGSVAWWFDVGNTGTAEPAHGADRSVEITTITASDSAATVAGKLETAMHADSQYSASSASDVVTITDAAVGARADATPGTTEFTFSVTTQGAEPGIGAGTYKYMLQAQYKDAAGNLITGEPTEATTDNPDESITLGASTDNVNVTITGIKDTSKYNTAAARVNGNQSSVTSITVDSGHGIKAGDTIYLYDSTTGVSDYVERTVASVGATSVVVTESVSVSDNDVISANLRILIWRTQDSGDQMQLVASVPNNPYDATFTYLDGKTDTQLGINYIEQIKPHTTPPKGKYLAVWKGQLVIAGGREDTTVNSVYLSYIGDDGQTSEYFPAVNEYLMSTGSGDKIKGLAANNELLAVLKERSIMIGSGDPGTGYVSFDALTETDTGCQAHATITTINGALTWLDDDGVYSMVGGRLPTEISGNVRPILTNPRLYREVFDSSCEFDFSKAVGFNDKKAEKYYVFIPCVETTNGDKWHGSKSFTLVYDYYAGRDSWSLYTNYNMGGGVTKRDNEVVFVDRVYSTFKSEVAYLCFKQHNSGTKYDYADHTVSIPFEHAYPWDDMGEPEFFKRPVRWKIHPFEESLSATFSLRVTLETDNVDGDFLSDFTVNVNTARFTSGEQAGTQRNPPTHQQRFRPTKCRTFRLRYFASTINEQVLIPGCSVECSTNYRQNIRE